MSKLNPTIRTSKFEEERLAGGMGLKAAKQPDYLNLRRMVLAGLLWEDNFYVDGYTAGEQILELCKSSKITAKEITDLAIECRVVQKMRHMPLYLLVCALKVGKGQHVAEALPQVATRADMLTDFLAIYKEMNGTVKPLAKQAKIGLGEAFRNFNEYALAKYDRDAQIKLRDVLRLVHPKPENQEQAVLWKKVLDRTLKVPDTWEVAISATKGDAGAKKVEWTRLIQEGKLGGLAFLRNLRNMKEAGVSLNVIREGLKNVKTGMLLPLNYFAAYSENPEFQREIENLMLDSYKNLPKLPGKTKFILDRSGSMGAKISGKSKFSRQQVANAMAMLAVNMCEDCELIVTAGSDYTGQHYSEVVKYPNLGFGLFDQITKCNIGGGGIFTRQVLEWSKQSGECDRIIIFSDSQDCDRVNKVPKPYGTFNYIVDVSAHQHGVNFKGAFTAELSGWSEHFLTYISAFEGLQNNFEE